MVAGKNKSTTSEKCCMSRIIYFLKLGHTTEIDMLPLEDSFPPCVEERYTYRRHSTHNHSLNRSK
ncbi:hypothetical protein NQ317_003753 [Molorchus minor]|uniref:Uncharacterized protein n=1 Tax=Molorchus minor TaxID=1323400 RepID=A0ABQ9JPR3_9CUCU|nr:hypothetical protein NQ317_003753 [Molorchus minor]